MTTALFARWGAVTAALALTLTALPLTQSAAAPAAWKPGDCFARASVFDDVVELGSKVNCARPHRVQIIGGAALPASLAALPLAELKDDANTAVLDQLVAFSHEVCSPAKTAPNIWPGKGAAVAAALRPAASVTGGGVLPGLRGTTNFGWLFPDAKSFEAGDRSLICVLYAPKGQVGSPQESMGTMRGDARLLATSRPLPTMRTCVLYDAEGFGQPSSCAKPHGDELMAFFAARLPANYADMTDAQWAPYDDQCRGVVEALVGAARPDLRAYVDASARPDAGTLVYLSCYVQRQKAADGSYPLLPGGTVVGLGKKPLSGS
ncbi:MAG: Septum formation [Actinomycetota bacterium]|nr:Septum formation [Actinomycetota bacterium]